MVGTELKLYKLNDSRLFFSPDFSSHIILLVGSVSSIQCMFPFVLFHMSSRGLIVAHFWNLIYYVNVVIKAIVFLSLRLILAMLLCLSFSLFFLGFAFLNTLLVSHIFFGILPTIR